VVFEKMEDIEKNGITFGNIIIHSPNFVSLFFPTFTVPPSFVLSPSPHFFPQDLDPEKERTITNYLKLAQHHLTVDKDLNNAEACYRAAGNIAEISDILIGLGNIRRMQNRYANKGKRDRWGGGGGGGGGG
jgi:hypothetical protein